MSALQEEKGHAVPTEKFARLSRFGETFEVSVGPSFSHPKTGPLSKRTHEEKTSNSSGSSKQYLFFLSRDFMVREVPKDSKWTSVCIVKGHAAKPISLSHPAFAKNFPSTSAGPLPFDDINRAVYFSQLTSALLGGSPVRVADLRKVTPAVYRSSFIAGLKTNIDLLAVSTTDSIYSPPSVIVRKYREIGFLHFLIASRLLRNEDFAPSNIGVAEGALVAFDFDRNGIISPKSCRVEQAKAWGFSAEGIDKSTWVPPFSYEPHRDGEGPKRWIDRHEIEAKVAFDKQEFSRAHDPYFYCQNIWRLAWHDLGSVHLQYYLSFKFLILPENWLACVEAGFIGASDLGGKLNAMKEDVYSALLKSALFRLDLFLRGDVYYAAQLNQDFATYNQSRWPGDKPKNAKYCLRLEPEEFKKMRLSFLFPHALPAEDQDARCAYLQFLILLSHLKVSDDRQILEKSAYPEDIPEIRATLSESNRDKIAFFKFLFATVSREASYQELFFLCKVFQIFYPTLERVKVNSWLTFGGIPVDVEGTKKRFYFPGNAKWAFKNFEVATLQSQKARSRYRPLFSNFDQIGRESPEEADSEMAQLIRNESFNSHPYVS